MKHFVQHHYRLLQILLPVLVIFVMGVYVNIVTQAVTSKSISSLQAIYSLGWWNALLAAGIILAYLQNHLVRIPLMRLQSVRDDLISSILKTACRTLIYPNKIKHIRAVVTLRDGTTGLRRTKYSYNASADPERLASYPLGFGITGQAYEKRCVVASELPTDHLSEYTPDIQDEVLPEIKSILAAPLLNMNDPNKEPLGVLAFDSVHELSYMKFDKLEIRVLAQEWADIVAQILTNTEN